MPYTLAMGTIWFALALVVGLLIGWLLRSIVAKRQVERARSYNADHAELERLRGRIRNLETAAAERDGLRADLEAARNGSDRSDAAVGGAAEVSPSGAGGPDVKVSGAPESDAGGPDPTRSGTDPAGSTQPEATVPDRPEMAAAAAVLGHDVELDDLKVIEGIGPKVESLCHGIGIRTWHDLSTTEVSLLKTMLDDAGPRFRTHDPTTWPEQAGLLAAGRWTDFRELTQRVGRS